MTAEFGPLDSDHEPGGGVVASMAGTMIASTAALYNYFTDGSIRYEPEQNRLSLHGKSENPGSGFKAGVEATLIAVSASIMAFGPLVVVGEIGEMVDGSVFTIIVGLLLVVVAVVTTFVFEEIIDRLTGMEVLDHTTQAVDDDRLNELASQFANGDLTAAEHERRVEQVLESEGRPVEPEPHIEAMQSHEAVRRTASESEAER